MIPRRELVIVLVFLTLLAGGLLWSIKHVFQPEQPPPAETLYVEQQLTYDGAAYLLWSDGQITPDMAEHRRFIIRAISAQAILEKQR